MKQKKIFKVFHVEGYTVISNDKTQEMLVHKTVLVDNTGLSCKVLMTKKLNIGDEVEATYQLTGVKAFKVKQGSFKLQSTNKFNYRFETWLENPEQEVIDYLFGKIIYTVYNVEKVTEFIDRVFLVEPRFYQQVSLDLRATTTIIENVKIGDTFWGEFRNNSINIHKLPHINHRRVLE